jgi:hypothetical protein
LVAHPITEAREHHLVEEVARRVDLRRELAFEGLGIRTGVCLSPFDAEDEPASVLQRDDHLEDRSAVRLRRSTTPSASRLARPTRSRRPTAEARRARV